MESTHTLSSGLHSLVIFRNLLNDPVISRLLALLDTDPSSGAPFVDAYCEFASALLARTDDFSQYLLGAALEDENFYVTVHGSMRPHFYPVEVPVRLKLPVLLSCPCCHPSYPDLSVAAFSPPRHTRTFFTASNRKGFMKNLQNFFILSIRQFSTTESKKANPRKAD